MISNSYALIRMGTSLRYLTICLLAAYGNGKIIYSSKPVQVDLFYEALCPGCTKFVTAQLFPTWKELGDSGIISVSLYPFGNARESQLPNGTYQYTCQHGEEECEGNKIEACIIKNENFQPDEYLPKIACMESKVQDGDSVDDAFTKCSLPAKIKDCANGQEGSRLMHKIALRTAALTPPHTYVPWIVFNGVHSEAYNDEAFTDLLKLVCSLYKGADKPKSCYPTDLRKCYRNDI